MRRQPLIVLLFAVAACKASPDAVIPDGTHDSGARAPYFSPELGKTFQTCVEVDGHSRRQQLLSDFESAWFSKHLRAAEEPSLYSKALANKLSVQQIVRFTWLRTFHPPVIVRLTADQKGEWKIIAKELSGAGGYDPGNVKRTVGRTLTAKEMTDLRTLLSISTLPDNSVDCTLGMDGAEWIIERLDENGYHFIKRWSPADGPVRNVGLFLTSLTGWQYKDVY